MKMITYVYIVHYAHICNYKTYKDRRRSVSGSTIRWRDNLIKVVGTRCMRKVQDWSV